MDGQTDKMQRGGPILQPPCDVLDRTAIFSRRSDPRGARVNKQDLVDAVAKRLGITKAKATEITELFFAENGIIAAELRRGGKIAISGFGNFETRTRAARVGRNPRTGKAITLKASTAPAFRAARALKDLVNRKR
jgi:DNA-binding protein HU-beta